MYIFQEVYCLSACSNRFARSASKQSGEQNKCGTPSLYLRLYRFPRLERPGAVTALCALAASWPPKAECTRVMKKTTHRLTLQLHKVVSVACMCIRAYASVRACFCAMPAACRVLVEPRAAWVAPPQPAKRGVWPVAAGTVVEGASVASVQVGRRVQG